MRIAPLSASEHGGETPCRDDPRRTYAPHREQRLVAGDEKVRTGCDGHGQQVGIVRIGRIDPAGQASLGPQRTQQDIGVEYDEHRLTPFASVGQRLGYELFEPVPR